MPNEVNAPTVISGLAQVAGDYDVLLCDIWGVLHNSVFAFPEASAALEKKRQDGAQVVLVSNAPRPNPVVAAELDALGVPRASYDALVTSGDVTRAMLKSCPGIRVLHLGPRRDAVTFAGLDILMTDLEDADIVVCTDLIDEAVETPDDYRTVLKLARARNLQLICANPDVVVERGEKLVYCAGAIAQLYEDIGGSTVYCGKPDLSIYELALKIAAGLRGVPVDKKRVLAIGDALRTDVAGAARAGVDSLFIASGIHTVELNAENGAVPDNIALAALFAGSPCPKWVMSGLAP